MNSGNPSTSTGHVGVSYLKHSSFAAFMLAVTMLPSYLYCKRKLYLNKALGLREPVNEALVKGVVRHRAYEDMSKAEELLIKSITTKSFKEVLELFNKKHGALLLNAITSNKYLLNKVRLNNELLFEDVLPLVMQESKARAQKVFRLIEQEDVLGDELWSKTIPKPKPEFRIESKDLKLRGIIDRIDVYQDKLVPVELKTGKAPHQGVWDGHRIQIAAYCMLLEDHFNISVKQGVVNYLDWQKERNIVMNPFLQEEVLELIEKTTSLVDSDICPKHDPNKNKCKICGLREQCFDENFLKKHKKVTSVE